MNMRKRKNEYKPLLFTTTLRNPERIKSFLDIINKYDGKTLTNFLIDNIVRDLIKTKVYVPTYVNKNISLKSIYNSDREFSNNDVDIIIKNSPQNHKEAGFDKGWPSRFDTWYKFLKELGLVYYEIGKPIEVSDAGKMLIKSKEEGYQHLEKDVFLNCFAKYQRNNPFRTVSNSNKPLILLLKTIFELRSRVEEFVGINISEIPLFICWKDDNEKELADLILSLRKKYRYNISDEVIYDECKKILNFTTDQEKRFKISNICHEMPDDFIRKMRMTGLITLRGGGRFIDANNKEIEKTKYVVNRYSLIGKFDDTKAYFEYAKTIDKELVELKPSDIPTQEKIMLFKKWVAEFEYTKLVDELLILKDSRKKSTDNILKFIDEPLRFEFLTALLIQKKFNDLYVLPNYLMDDEGLPTSFATGNCPDIICRDSTGNILVEVSLISSRQQVTAEILSIERHLLDIKNNDINAFTVFVAPYIHPDSTRYIEFRKAVDNLVINAYGIDEFIIRLSLTDNFRKITSV